MYRKHAFFIKECSSPRLRTKLGEAMLKCSCILLFQITKLRRKFYCITISELYESSKFEICQPLADSELMGLIVLHHSVWCHHSHARIRLSHVSKISHASNTELHLRRVLSKLALTMLMIFSMKAVFINIFQSVKTVCSKKISSWYFEVQFGSGICMP